MGGTFFLVFALRCLGLFADLAGDQMAIVGLGSEQLASIAGRRSIFRSRIADFPSRRVLRPFDRHVMILFLAAGAEYCQQIANSDGNRSGLLPRDSDLQRCIHFIRKLSSAFPAFNKELVEFAQILRSTGPNQGDLIVARALTVDDNCAWVSLLSSAHSFFVATGRYCSAQSRTEHSAFPSGSLSIFLGEESLLG